MIRLLFGRELRAYRRAFLLWLVPVAGLLVMTISLQPSMTGHGGGLLAAKLEAMPEALRRAFGLTTVDFRRPAAYLAINLVYVTLTSSLLGAWLGSTVIAKEEAQRTAELLYTQPVARTRILLGKAAAVAWMVVVFNVALAAIAIAALAGFAKGPTEPRLIAQVFAGTTALGLCFAGAGMVIATVVRRARSAGAAATGVALGTYLFGVTTATSPRIEALGRISPFRHVEPPKIVLAGAVDVAAVVALTLLGVAAGAIAITRYRHRDLAA